MTPALQYLKQHNIAHVVHRYDHDPSVESYGTEAALKMGVPPEQVFKTLVVKTSDNQLAVAVLPVTMQLSLKNMAKQLGVKKVAMASADAVVRSTGYVLGGVSPLAQKSPLRTVVDESAHTHSAVFVSAGQRGLEIEMSPADLCGALKSIIAPIGML